MNGYGDCFIPLELYLVRFIPDMPSCGRREQAQFSSERTPRHPGFGGVVSALHHESVDAGWEHYSLYKNEPECRSSDACTCPLVEIDGNNLLTIAIDHTSVPWPHASSRVGYLTQQY